MKKGLTNRQNRLTDDHLQVDLLKICIFDGRLFVGLPLIGGKTCDSFESAEKASLIGKA